LNKGHKQNRKFNPLEIFIFRKTLKTCREGTFADFEKCMRHIGIWDETCAGGQNQSPQYTLWGNKIYFRGVEELSEKNECDIIFYNEIMDEQNEAVVEKLLLRCKKLAIFDWNPRFSYHWIFKWENRFNVFFTKTTWRNNKYIPEVVLADLLSKCPWDFSDWDEENNCWKSIESERPRNERNFQNGTINKRFWLVYGQGERCPEDGAIIKDYKWIDSFPTDGFDEVSLGIDFGFSNDPTVLGRCGRVDNKLYGELLSYEPTPTPKDCYNLVSVGLKIEEQRRMACNGGKKDEMWIFCDSADKNRNDEEYVIALNEFAMRDGHNWNFVKVRKKSVGYGLDIINGFDLHFVHNVNLETEIQNYVYKIVEGNTTNIPIDAFNHYFDQLRYAVLGGISDKLHK
jgi:phage terminase large subunit